MNRLTHLFTRLRQTENRLTVAFTLMAVLSLAALAICIYLLTFTQL